MQTNQIRICFHSEEGWTECFPGLLIGNNLAYVIYDEHLEINIIEPTSDPNEYEIGLLIHSMFHVGQNAQEVLEDIRNLTMFDFARKYASSNVVEQEQ